MAEERGAITVSFPAISTGVYGYPLREAAAIAIREVKSHLEQASGTVREVTLVLFDRHAWKTYAAVLGEHFLL